MPDSTSLRRAGVTFLVRANFGPRFSTSDRLESSCRSERFLKDGVVLTTGPTTVSSSVLTVLGASALVRVRPGWLFLQTLKPPLVFPNALTRSLSILLISLRLFSWRRVSKSSLHLAWSQGNRLDLVCNAASSSRFFSLRR